MLGAAVFSSNWILNCVHASNVKWMTHIARSANPSGITVKPMSTVNMSMVKQVSLNSIQCTLGHCFWSHLRHFIQSMIAIASALTISRSCWERIATDSKPAIYFDWAALKVLYPLDTDKVYEFVQIIIYFWSPLAQLTKNFLLPDTIRCPLIHLASYESFILLRFCCCHCDISFTSHIGLRSFGMLWHSTSTVWMCYLNFESRKGTLTVK